jgi:hypothetical protein
MLAGYLRTFGLLGLAIVTCLASGCAGGFAARVPHDLAARTAPREIDVLVVGDPTFHAIPGARARALGAIERLSRRWEGLFGVRFRAVEYRVWSPPAWMLPLPILAEYEALKRIDRQGADLVVGFTLCTGFTVLGEADIGGDTLIACQAPTAALDDVLHHEMAHVFGAEHTWVPSAIFPAVLPWPLQPGWFTRGTRETIETQLAWRFPPNGVLGESRLTRQFDNPVAPR